MDTSTVDTTPLDGGDFFDIHNLLQSEEARCYQIGTYLKLKQSLLSKIKTNASNSADALSQIITNWLQHNYNVGKFGPPTWKALAEAVQAPGGGNNTALAEEIARQHQASSNGASHPDSRQAQLPGANSTAQQVASQATKDQVPKDQSKSSGGLPLDPNTVMDLQHILRMNLKDIQRRFASYVATIYKRIENSGVNVNNLRIYLQCLSATELEDAESEQQCKLLSSISDELEKSKTLSDIFEVLINKWASFLNYDIFESIVSKYRIQKDCDALMYSQHLKAYLCKHKISEFISISPTLEKYVGTSNVLFLKFKTSTKKKLSELFDLRSSVAGILGIMPSALRLISIEEGCVAASFLIPAQVADAVFSGGLTTKQEKELKALSCAYLRCGSYEFYNYDSPDEILPTSSGLIHVQRETNSVAAGAATDGGRAVSERQTQAKRKESLQRLANIDSSTILVTRNISHVSKLVKDLTPAQAKELGIELGLSYSSLSKKPNETLHLDLAQMWILGHDDSRSVCGQPTWRALALGCAKQELWGLVEAIERKYPNSDGGVLNVGTGSRVEHVQSTSPSLLGIDDKRAVLSEVGRVASLWEDFGLALDLKQDTLDQVRSDNADSSSRLSAVISEWLRGNGGERSWKYLADALRDPLVGRPDLSDQVAAKHL